MQIMSSLEQELARYMDLSVLEQKVTAQNMANVDTPGYRTVGFDFADAMRRSVEQMAEARAARQNQMRAQLDGGQGGVSAAPPMLPVSDAVEIHQVGGLLERPDGNDVSVDREGMKMAEAQLQFRIGMELLRQQFKEVSDAIHAAD
jgi:flagellar basal-body rod protein FlgB